MPLQIDGEPCNIEPSGEVGSSRLISTSRDGQALLLARRRAEGGGVSAFAAVEGQLSEEAISTGQRDALLNALGGA